MLILVLNLLTRIKLGRHTWCARHAPKLCMGGPMARGVWILEFPWFVGSQQTMSLTATSALLMWLGCNMSVKMHYLFSHMGRFPENLGSMSDEQGKRFHQDLKEMETRYQGRWDAVMMADYCWNLKRELPATSRSSKKWKFKPWGLNNGEATCNLRVLTFVNANHSVHSNRCFYQVINICCWQNIFS